MSPVSGSMRTHLVGTVGFADAMALSPTVTRLGPEGPASAGWLATRLTLSRNVSRRRPGCCADFAAACRPGLHQEYLRYVTGVHSEGETLTGSPAGAASSQSTQVATGDPNGLQLAHMPGLSNAQNLDDDRRFYV